MNIAPVGQGVTHRGVPLYGHTDHEVDGATERDPDQESWIKLLLQLKLSAPVKRVVQVGEQQKQPLGIETLKIIPNSIKKRKDQMNTESTFYKSCLQTNLTRINVKLK